MLKQKIYKKGKQILTVEDLKKATSTLFLSYKNNKDNYFWIDNPVVNQSDASGDNELIDFWSTDKCLQTYDIYERLIEDRRPIFSEEIDEMLDDMFSEFAYTYTDSENYQEDFMEQLLEELNYRFKIEEKNKDEQ